MFAREAWNRQSGRDLPDWDIWCTDHAMIARTRRGVACHFDLHLSSPPLYISKTPLHSTSVNMKRSDSLPSSQSLPMASTSDHDDHHVPVTPQKPKPKKPPTVTPRRFRSFFTPRNMLEGIRKSHGRDVLGDITSGPGANVQRFRGKKNKSPRKSMIELFEDNLEEKPARKRRRASFSSAIVEVSSPSKRSRHDQPSEDLSCSEDCLEDDVKDVRRIISQLRPVVRSKFRTHVGAVYRRETGLSSESSCSTSTHTPSLLLEWSQLTWRRLASRDRGLLQHTRRCTYLQQPHR